jgi:putative membrane protein
VRPAGNADKLLRPTPRRAGGAVHPELLRREECSIYSSALMAFLHHVAAFSVVAALAVEVALFKPPLSLVQARRLMRTDTIYGVAAGTVLVVGLLRVEYFEKGPAYYWHDVFFLMKFAAFLVAALISVYPTLVFLSWSRTLKAGTAPEISAERTRRVRMCLMLELALILVILLGAALMARGFGYLR